MALRNTYPKTNLFLIDKKLWNWAKYRSTQLGHKSVSQYIFTLIEKDKETT